MLAYRGLHARLTFGRRCAAARAQHVWDSTGKAMATVGYEAVEADRVGI